MTDSFKELRSMILLELCCPPLPLMAVRKETGEQTVTNTHDVMSVFMITAFKRLDQEENNRRKLQQLIINRAYQDGLADCETFIQTYIHMANFMTEYLATYLLPGSGYMKEDIRILSADYISPHLKEEIRSYCAAMRIIAGLDEDARLSEHGVDSLFMDCARSAIHKKQQGVVSMPILEGVGEGVSEERHDPQALEPCVEVL
jgi:hypothetical protein